MGPIKTVTDSDLKATTVWSVADMMFCCTSSSSCSSCSWSVWHFTVIIADPVSTNSCVGMSFIAPDTRVTVGVIVVRDSSLLSLSCLTGVLLKKHTAAD